MEIDSYAPTYNPAFFGMIERDILYSWPSQALEGGEEYRIQVGNYYLREIEATQRFGYILPLGERLGLGVEIVWADASNLITKVDGSPIYTFESQNYSGASMDNSIKGAYAGLGYRLKEGLKPGRCLSSIVYGG